MNHIQMKERLEGFLGQSVDVPEPPELPDPLTRQLDAFGFEIIFLPNLELTRSYAHWKVKPENRYWETEIVERTSLPGRWLAIERLAMPELGCKATPDPVMNAFGLESRFGHSWDSLHEATLPRLADMLEVSRSRVRLPWLIERNFCGNLFAHMAANDTSIPNWRSSPVWEWCENRYGRYHALLTGRFGLASVGWCFSADEWYGIFAWRTAIELSAP